MKYKQIYLSECALKFFIKKKVCPGLIDNTSILFIL